MHFKSLFAIAAVTLLPSLVFAGPGPLQEACRNDVKTLCGSIQPGGGRIRDCMMEHRAQISNSCKLAIAERIGASALSLIPLAKLLHAHGLIERINGNQIG